MVTRMRSRKISISLMVLLVLIFTSVQGQQSLDTIVKKVDTLLHKFRAQRIE